MATNPTAPSINCPQAILRAGSQGIQRVAVNDVKAQLLVTFFRPLVLPQQSYLLSPANYVLTGGARLFPHVIKAELAGPAQVLLTLDGIGDFSIYTLTVSGPDVDPFFSSRKLRFRLGCDDRFDCRPPAAQQRPSPELPVVIDYLAKDYSSFRQALLDFVGTRMPEWTERSEADLGMMLLELFAYTADNLSYMQDRVANEAFLETATQRRSVAGHLQLIGYQMDEGASAHTWLQFQVNGVHNVTRELKVSNQPKTAAEPLTIFEPLVNVRLDPAHNSMQLFTWGNSACCLPPTAFSAALMSAFPDLADGDYLLIDDGKGHRDVVQISERPQVVPSPVPVTAGDMITVVKWSDQTPLHFNYCASDVTVRGNMVLATHGETVGPEKFKAPAPTNQRLRIKLSSAPLAHIDPSTQQLVPQSAAPTGSSTLQLTVDGAPWQQRFTLLDGGPDATSYRVEIDDEGEATIVFGQGGTDTPGEQFGLRPPENADIEAVYRVGGGSKGNVAADTLILPHPSEFDPLDWFVSVTNPIAATGGRDLESRDHARRVGPPTFHKPLVAVTVADYQNAAQAFAEPNGVHPIQRAKAAFRWTGSWLTVTLGVDPLGGEALTPQLRADLLNYLDGRRLAGYDLEVTGATYVPVDLIVNFCVKAGFRPIDVQQSIERALRTFFDPDNFSFGDSIYVSRLLAAIMTAPGVESARITRLARLHSAHPETETQINLAKGFFGVGPNDIVRLDNDRNFPENGVWAVQTLEVNG